MTSEDYHRNYAKIDDTLSGDEEVDAYDNGNDEKEDESDDDDGSTLHSSVLGTKSYWDEAYEKEIKNFEQIGDEGTVWFGEDSLRRVVKWLNGQQFDKEKCRVLDLGSGNGSMLLSLATSGWRRLVGVDYSRGAVKLAASIARKKVADGWLKDFHIVVHDDEGGGSSDTRPSSLPLQCPVDSASVPFLAYSVFDLTRASDPFCGAVDDVANSATMKYEAVTFEVVLDKGTFDAISLCPDAAEEKKRRYVEFLKTALSKERRGAVFCLTSCNWTEEELVRVFETDFKIKDRIEFPSFRFGGKTGSTVTSLVFEWK